jgi:cell division protein FtsZ
VEHAIASPLLESSIDGARGVLINFIGGRDMSLQEVNQAAELVSSRVDDDANIIFGATVDEEKRDRVRVMILATGFSADVSSAKLPQVANHKDAPQVKLIYEDAQKQRPAPPRLPEPVLPQTKQQEPEEDLDIPAFLRRLKK